MPYGPFDLSEKVAVVTGGNGGIGLGMAKALAQAGAAVSIWGRNADKNAAAKSELESLGGKVQALRCDVGEEAQVDECFAAAVSEFGHVDACFANAGVGGGARSFMEMTTEQWRGVLRTNLDGVFFTFRAAARHMVDSGRGGSLAVTASLAAIEGQARGQNYAASKGAVISMTKAIAVELARHNVRANAIVPGWIDTDMTSFVFATPQFGEKVLKRVPFRRWGTGDDFGGIAVYLASDASAYHSGDVIVIDGGYAIF